MSACPRRCARRSRCAPATPATSSAQQEEIERAAAQRGDRAARTDLDYAAFPASRTRCARQLTRGAPGDARPGRAHPGRDAGGGVDPARASEEALRGRAAPQGRMSGFIAQLRHAWQQNDSLVCVGLDPEIERFPRHIAGAGLADLPVQQGDHRRHGGPGVRLQAAVRALRRLRGRRPARAHHRVHPPHLPGRPGDPRRQARRCRQHRRALRHRGLRALRRGCRDRQPVPRRRCARAVPAPRGQGRDRPVPHLQSRRRAICRTWRSAAASSTRSVAQLAAQRWNTRGNCLLVVGATYPQRARRGARARRRHAACWCRASARRAADVAQAVQRGQSADRHRTHHQLLARASCTPPRGAGLRQAAAARAATTAAARRDQCRRRKRRARCRLLSAVPRALGRALGCSPGGACGCSASGEAAPAAAAAQRDPGARRRPGSGLARSAEGARHRGAEHRCATCARASPRSMQHAAVAPGVARELERERRRPHLHLPPASRGALVERRPGGGGGFRGGPASAWSIRPPPPQYAQYVDVIANAQRHRRGRKPPQTLGVSAPDDATVVMRLAAPAPYLPGAAVASEHLSGASRRRLRATATASRARASWCRTAPSCSRSGCRARTCSALRNHYYWNDAATRLEAVKYLQIADENAELTRYRAGELQVTCVVPRGQFDWIRANLGDRAARRRRSSPPTTTASICAARPSGTSRSCAARSRWSSTARSSHSWCCASASCPPTAGCLPGSTTTRSQSFDYRDAADGRRASPKRSGCTREAGYSRDTAARASSCATTPARCTPSSRSRSPRCGRRRSASTCA